MRDAVDDIIEQWRRERPELDVSSIAVIGRLSRVSRAIERSMDEVFAAHGLQSGWFDVLASLRRAGGDCELTPSELTATMMLTSGGLTKRLDRLEEEDLVERRPDPRDGRGVLVRLTAAGCERVDAAADDHLANQRRVLGPLSDRQRTELARALRVLGVSLDQ